MCDNICEICKYEFIDNLSGLFCDKCYSLIKLPILEFSAY